MALVYLTNWMATYEYGTNKTHHSSDLMLSRTTKSKVYIPKTRLCKVVCITTVTMRECVHFIVGSLLPCFSATCIDYKAVSLTQGDREDNGDVNDTVAF